MKSSKIKTLTLAGLFAAIIYITTAYLHIPSHTGFTHVGDAFIYLAASIFPLPYALLASVLGAMLADVLTGFAIWAPASMIIKALVVVLFTNKNKKIVCKRNLFALIISGVITLLGYYLYDAIFISNFIVALSGILGYIIQSVLSGILFAIIGAAFDKMNIRSKIL